MQWYQMPTFKKILRARFYLPSFFSHLFSKRFLEAMRCHKKRILFYSVSFIIIAILIFVNIKIIHSNDDLEISYCANYDYNNLPPPCQKLARENNQYNTSPSPDWPNIYDDVEIYATLKQFSSSGGMKFDYYDMDKKEIANNAEGNSWFWGGVYDDKELMDNFVKYVEENRTSVFKITGVRGDDDCGYLDGYCFEDIKIKQIERVN